MSARRTAEKPLDGERQLLARAQSSAEGFGDMFDQYYDRIYAYAFRRVGVQVAAEDIASCVFEDALRNIKKLRWQGKPIIAWLYRVASRRVADYYRDKQNRTVEAQEHFSPTEDEPDKSLERIETHALVQSGLERLGTKDRELIQLTFFDQVSATEIAAMWDITPNSVYVRLHRALKRLGSILEEDHEVG